MKHSRTPILITTLLLALTLGSPVGAKKRKGSPLQQCRITHTQEECTRFSTPLHPCETAEDRELGRPFSYNCDLENKKGNK